MKLSGAKENSVLYAIFWSIDTMIYYLLVSETFEINNNLNIMSNLKNNIISINLRLIVFYILCIYLSYILSSNRNLFSYSVGNNSYLISVSIYTVIIGAISGLIIEAEKFILDLKNSDYFNFKKWLRLKVNSHLVSLVVFLNITLVLLKYILPIYGLYIMMIGLLKPVFSDFSIENCIYITIVIIGQIYSYNLLFKYLIKLKNIRSYGNWDN